MQILKRARIRFLVSLLAFAIAFSSLGVPAFAAGYEFHIYNTTGAVLHAQIRRVECMHLGAEQFTIPEGVKTLHLETDIAGKCVWHLRPSKFTLVVDGGLPMGALIEFEKFTAQPWTYHPAFVVGLRLSIQGTTAGATVRIERTQK